MATFEETFNPAALARSDTVTSTTSNIKGPPGSATKPGKTTQNNYPRVDLEPLYSELKLLIGHNWDTYYDALTRFIRGIHNARNVLTEHAHNSLIIAVLCNTTKDPPEPGLAAWVSAATDKATLAASSKPAVTSDAGEQRLKAEVMALPARDRRRLKAVANDKAEEEAAARKNPYEDYYTAGRIKAPETATTTTAAGITKTNWDLEIRKRYLQPLFSETLEFPDSSTIHGRIVPICYEEAVASGCSMQCAEYVGIAAETYLKSVISEVFDRVRSDGPRYDNSASGGILTSAYKKKIAREEEEVKAGKLSKTRDDDLLPCEAQAAYSRKPISMADLQLTSRVGPLPWDQTPLIGWTITNASAGHDYDEWHASRGEPQAVTNGHVEKMEDAMDVDSSDNYGWEGAGSHDTSALESVLADCLAVSV
ncbi:hypothetical protein LTR10_020236 [Elasticomyces elasticus]|uniref:Transcriptional coactivator HFI1/ADA1 n=1 Tax=Exophiala sideris TaxID=1016849 RepID=A0ABR0JRV0_9EURO|nr:hypothetical protein LTR10_020236 [Elasticomyces elasticus]KAK5040298.1 hypothetical protein LTS07_000796 [Exophiala sideris]KAK5068676.1 hypothetical protein LTR69_000797 [Exophiala sideris]KAK5186274.1 hypothetical protein LTR44_001330 [Eurotiomycetes sp. CCFEE 6388]